MLLEEKVYIKINNTTGWAKVRFIYPFLMGHSVWLSLGMFNMDDFAETLKPHDKFEVVIIDKENFVAKEYFDIETNYWYLEGLDNALRRGKIYVLLHPHENLYFTYFINSEENFSTSSEYHLK